VSGASWSRSPPDGVDISNNSVRSGDIRTGNVRSSDVRNDSLTGGDINESTLGTVPSASNSNTVGNQTPAQLRSTAAFSQNAVPTALPAAFTTVVSTTITTQSPGLVQALGSAELEGANGLSEGRCRIVIAGTSGVNLEGASDDVGAPDPFVILLSLGRTLPAGTHAVSLQCQRDNANAVTKDDATLSVTGTPG